MEFFIENTLDSNIMEWSLIEIELSTWRGGAGERGRFENLDSTKTPIFSSSGDGYHSPK